MGRELSTEEGERLKLIYPGRINGDSGPDFRDAVIIMNETGLVKGDVEIHIKSSDWYSHGHHDDPEYNGVVLHVVRWHDCNSTLRQNGKPVPVVYLSPKQWHRTHHLPCFQAVRRKDRQCLRSLLDAAGEERFRQKAALFQARLEQEEAGQVLYQGMMRALGYSKNTEPFEELAHKVPLNFIEKIKPKGSLVLKQAWLLGIAGLLSSQRLQGKFPKEVWELKQVWQSVGEKAETMDKNDWRISHVYPNNSPVRRIVAQSYILQRYCKEGLLQGMLQLVGETPSIAGYRLEDGLIVTGEGYWQEHFDFGVRSRVRNSALLGHGKAGEIVVNIILPFASAWGEIANEPELGEGAINLYVHYPRLAENEITSHMAKQLCLQDVAGFTACHQQGLIHIFRNYCREGKCSRCPLAN